MDTASEKVKAIQRIVGVVDDGIPGRRTRAAIEALFDGMIHPTRPVSPDSPLTALDERTEKNIATLLPAAQKKAREFMAALRLAGINARIISGNRTWAEQDALYSQGRTKPGNIVTNAKGGHSTHNFQIAWDIGIFGTDGKYYGEHPDYRAAGEIGRSMGIDWGGDWKTFTDLPHFGLKTGLTLAQMRAKHEQGIAIA